MPQSLAKKLLSVGGSLLALWVGLRFFLPILLPFLLAAALALAAEPLVSLLCRRTKMSRAVATGISITMALCLLSLTVMVLMAILLRQLRALAGVVPDLAVTARQGMGYLEHFLTQMAQNSPESVQPLLNSGVQGLFSNGAAFIERLAGWLLGLASRVLSGIPDSALGFGTWLLASFMLSARLPKIKAWLGHRLPPSWKERYLPMLRRLRASVLGWLTAQCKLIFLTFLVLWVGFSLLQIPHGMLWAALICLVDALPVLGTGTVLIPWAAVCLLQGDTVRALGLLGTYAVAWLLRSILEPRFIGRQLGLDPLVTLFAMYAGYRLFGLGGLLFAPILAVAVVQLATKPEK